MSPALSASRPASSPCRPPRGSPARPAERLSIDEAFADLAGTARPFGPPREIAEAIRRRVRPRQDRLAGGQARRPPRRRTAADAPPAEAGQSPHRAQPPAADRPPAAAQAARRAVRGRWLTPSPIARGRGSGSLLVFASGAVQHRPPFSKWQLRQGVTPRQ